MNPLLIISNKQTCFNAPQLSSVGHNKVLYLTSFAASLVQATACSLVAGLRRRIVSVAVTVAITSASGRRFIRDVAAPEWANLVFCSWHDTTCELMHALVRACVSVRACVRVIHRCQPERLVLKNP